MLPRLYSDFGSVAEGHREDFMQLSPTSHVPNDCSNTCDMPQRAICEMEVSVRCPIGWTFYGDDGSEGEDSCLLVSDGTAPSWAVANTSCPAGSHLLTVKSPIASIGLLPFATSLFPDSFGYAYIGCRCELVSAPVYSQYPVPIIRSSLCTGV